MTDCNLLLGGISVFEAADDVTPDLAVDTNVECVSMLTLRYKWPTSISLLSRATRYEDEIMKPFEERLRIAGSDLEIRS